MFDEKIKFKYSWRPYQARVLEEVDKYINDGKINIVAAPGSGKTVLGLELARRLGNPVLILSPTVTIKNQWIDRFVSLFMPEGTKEKPEWISDNVYKLSYFNSITYQGLHCAYKRKWEDEEKETDDDVLNEEPKDENNIETYDIIKKIKTNKISTIILDEAHHLKSEWWQSLTKVIASLEGVTIISLTATPPYDVEISEWDKYSKLCGNIDIEISVPELVAEKNLCPHQDYIYFSYPTKEEERIITEYQNSVKTFLQNLKQNQAFIEMIKDHPYIKNTEENIETILENTQTYSSMLIFLKYANVDVEKEKVQVLGHNKPIPKFTAEWAEVLLQNIVFSEDEYYGQYNEIIDVIKKELREIGAIEKRKIELSKNSKLEKQFVNSVSKLASINKIVEAEYANLKQDLRMVILTDYLRKEYLFDEQIEINKIGVFPIFLNLLKQSSSLSMAILTGSLFIVPKDQKEKLLENASANGLMSEEIEFVDIEKVPSYAIVKTSEKHRNLLMRSISKLFSNGDVNIIIGTTSLLGEGWDEPSINSLILASYVGSYVLSNQMRGRAIRTNDNPQKTANVWHLVCVSDVDKSILQNSDYETLKRRFKSFVGIGHSINVLENGIDRLDLIPTEFTKENIDRANAATIRISNNRMVMYERWFKLIDYYGGNKMKMNNQLEAKKEDIQNRFSIVEPSKILAGIIWTIIAVALYMVSESLESDFLASIKIMLWLIIIGIVVNAKLIIECIRSMLLLSPRKQLLTMAKIVVKSLCESGIVNTRYDDIKITTRYSKQSEYLKVFFSGITIHENNIIIDSLKEVFEIIENSRYIIVNKSRKGTSYYNVPGVLATNKEIAQIFHKNWVKFIGKAELVYTKNVEGRKVLIKARKKSFDYTKKSKFLEKKQPISSWK